MTTFIPTRHIVSFRPKRSPRHLGPLTCLGYFWAPRCSYSWQRPTRTTRSERLIPPCLRASPCLSVWLRPQGHETASLLFPAFILIKHAGSFIHKPNNSSTFFIRWIIRPTSGAQMLDPPSSFQTRHNYQKMYRKKGAHILSRIHS